MALATLSMNAESFHVSKGLILPLAFKNRFLSRDTVHVTGEIVYFYFLMSCFLFLILVFAWDRRQSFMSLSVTTLTKLILLFDIVFPYKSDDIFCQKS